MTNGDFPFDPTEIRLENEMRKMQLEKEFGMDFGQGSPDLPPALENQFLKNVLEIEKKFRENNSATPRIVIGNPAIPAADALSNDQEFMAQNTRILRLLAEKQIHVDIQGSYTHKNLFAFLQEKILDDADFVFFDIPGMIFGYSYNEEEYLAIKTGEAVLKQMFDWLEQGCLSIPEDIFCNTGPEKELGQCLLYNLRKMRQSSFSEFKIENFELIGYSVKITESGFSAALLATAQGETIHGDPWQGVSDTTVLFSQSAEGCRIVDLNLQRFIQPDPSLATENTPEYRGPELPVPEQ